MSNEKVHKPEIVVEVTDAVSLNSVVEAKDDSLNIDHLFEGSPFTHPEKIEVHEQLGRMVISK